MNEFSKQVRSNIAMKDNAHLDHPIPSTTDDLIRDKINAINLIGVSRQIHFNFIRFQIPDLQSNISPSPEMNIKKKGRTFNVLSLLALISILPSAFHASR